MSRILRKASVDKQGHEVTIRCDFPEQQTVNQEKQEEPSQEQIKADLAAEILSMRKEAEAQAQQLIVHAEQEQQQILQQARDTGFQKGYQEGMETGEQEAKELRSQATQLLDQAKHWHSRLVAESEHYLIELSTAIAAKLVRKELELSPQQIIAVAKEALSGINDGRKFLIYAHPEDAELLKGQKELLMQELSDDVSLRILADKSITSGGCLVDTDTGQVEVTIEGQLTRLKQVLKGEQP